MNCIIEQLTHGLLCVVQNRGQGLVHVLLIKQRFRRVGTFYLYQLDTQCCNRFWVWDGDLRASKVDDVGSAEQSVEAGGKRQGLTCNPKLKSERLLPHLPRPGSC